MPLLLRIIFARVMEPVKVAYCEIASCANPIAGPIPLDRAKGRRFDDCPEPERDETGERDEKRGAAHE